MKRILLDCRFAGKNVGIGRYTQGLVPELLKQSTHTFVVLLSVDDNGEWLPPTGNYTVVKSSIPHYSLREQLFLPLIAACKGCTTYTALHFNAPILVPASVHIVVHDLILHRYPNTESTVKKLVYKMLMWLAVHRAKTIVAVSKSTQADIADTYGKSVAKKVTHITEGIEEEFKRADEKRIAELNATLRFKRPYYLYVGNNKEHKNVPTLIEGFLQSSVATTHQLVLVCSAPNLQAQYNANPSITFVSGIETKDLITLYSGAVAFITASKYEGFCLPIIEARACNTPILAANSPAITELADTMNDTILFEPTIKGVANVLNASLSHKFKASTKGLVPWSAVAKDFLPLYNHG